MNPSEEADMRLGRAVRLMDGMHDDGAFDGCVVAEATAEATIAAALYLKDLFWLLGGR